MYLEEISEELASVLGGLIGQEYAFDVESIVYEPYILDRAETSLDEVMVGRTGTGATVKEQIVKIRRGQKIFKDNVQLNEKKCRITGVEDIQHLRASHISLGKIVLIKRGSMVAMVFYWRRMLITYLIVDLFLSIMTEHY